MILSYLQAEQIIQAIKAGKSQVTTSLDLNLSKTNLNIDGQNVVLPDGQKLSLKQLEKIVKKDNKCFLIEKKEIIPIQEFSETTNGCGPFIPPLGHQQPWFQVSICTGSKVLILRRTQL